MHLQAPVPKLEQSKHQLFCSSCRPKASTTSTLFFHSCARAHSKYPHPIPDGAESTSLGLLHTYKHNQKQITPSYYHRATQAHPAAGMPPTREVISRKQLSPHMELPPLCSQGSYIQDSTHILQASFVQGAEPKASEPLAAATK